MIKGATFDNQNVTSKIDGGFYRRIFANDGIVRGCTMSAMGTTFNIQPGLLIIGGRLIWIDSVESVELTNPINTGYAGIILTIDLSQESTVENFDQISASVVYSATPEFPALTQDDINGDGDGNIYQALIATVSLSDGIIANIIQTIGTAIINADKFGDRPPNYYAPASYIPYIVRVGHQAADSAQHGESARKLTLPHNVFVNVNYDNGIVNGDRLNTADSKIDFPDGYNYAVCLLNIEFTGLNANNYKFLMGFTTDALSTPGRYNINAVTSSYDTISGVTSQYFPEPPGKIGISLYNTSDTVNNLTISTRYSYTDFIFMKI